MVLMLKLQWMLNTIIIIISLLGEFFSPALVAGFSLDFEWQQVALSL